MQDIVFILVELSIMIFIIFKLGDFKENDKKNGTKVEPTKKPFPGAPPKQPQNITYIKILEDE